VYFDLFIREMRNEKYRNDRAAVMVVIVCLIELLIDWCLATILPVFQLYRSINVIT